MDKNFKKYIILWFSQSISQLGSAMTSFALILWLYTVRHSALTVSMMSFCSYVPYILISPFAGAFVDRHSKKKIMLIADSVAALCTCSVLLLTLSDALQIWHIYLINSVIGCMNAFQSPASSVALGKLVPQDKLANVSGMNSFSGNLTAVLTPVLAAALFAIDGLSLILFIDLGSFTFAFLVLLLAITIPEEATTKKNRESIFSGCKEGLRFLCHEKGILMIVLTMALLNFFSSLNYENILSPMLLARSGDNSLVIGIFNDVMVLGGILFVILV
ncbi:MAG: MFS transporter, partial [Acetatifactor sp.]|nr:MFS transporter [Acetatifactor sp.]